MKSPLFFGKLIRPAALLVFAFTAFPLQAQKEREIFTGPALDGETIIPPVDLVDPAALGTTADEAFAREEWMKAAAHYNGLLTIGSKVGVPPKELEPLYFVIGFSVFFVPHYDEALKRLKSYETQYPQGPNIDQVKLAIARCLRANKKWAEAINYYKPLSDKPELGEEVLVELAECYRENNERDKAITFLETKLVAGVKSREEMRAAILLADLYESKPAKGLAWLEKIKALPAAGDFVADVNMTAMKIAEVQMQAENFKEALRAFQILRPKEGVITSLKTRVDEYEKQLRELLEQKTRKETGPAQGRAKDQPYVLTMQRINRAKGFIEDTKRLSAAVAKEAHYDAVLTYRKGRCLAALQRYEEAGAAFQDVYTRYPEFTDRPNVLYALAYSHYMQVPENPGKDDLKLVDAADKLLVEFLNQWGKDRSESSQVADMRIQLATRTKDSARLNRVMEELDGQLKKSPAWSGYTAQRIHALLNRKEYDKAKVVIEQFLKEAPADDANRRLVEDMKRMIPEER